MEELAGSRRQQQEHHHLQHQPFAAAAAEPAAPVGMIKDVKPLAKVSGYLLVLHLNTPATNLVYRLY